MRRWSVLAVALVGCGRLDFDARLADDALVDEGPSGPRLIDIALGTAHTCMLDDQSRVKCWGQNPWGVLGAESSDTYVRGLAAGEPGSLPSVDLGGDEVIDLDARADYTCALTRPGVKCWGNNDGAQLGTGGFDHVGDQLGEMGRDMRLVALPATEVEQVITSHYHTCARSPDGTRCWGLNDLEQLGRESTLPLYTLDDLQSLAPVNLGSFLPVELTAHFNLRARRCRPCEVLGLQPRWRPRPRHDRLERQHARRYGRCAVLRGSRLRCHPDRRGMDAHVRALRSRPQVLGRQRRRRARSR